MLEVNTMWSRKKCTREVIFAVSGQCRLGRNQIFLDIMFCTCLWKSSFLLLPLSSQHLGVFSCQSQELETAQQILCDCGIFTQQCPALLGHAQSCIPTADVCLRMWGSYLILSIVSYDSHLSALAFTKHSFGVSVTGRYWRDDSLIGWSDEALVKWC